MMCKKLELTSIIILIFGAVVLGQGDFRDGFIITQGNDTIKGKVDYRSNLKNYESCVITNKQGTIEYYPNQINGFGYVNDKFFSSQIVEGSFVEVLVLGKISLYRTRKNYLLQKGDNFYELEYKQTEKEIDGQLFYVENSRWKGVTTYLISDCLSNSNNLTANLDLEEKSLTRLITRYNVCSATEFTEFKAKKQWTQIEIGLSTGMAITSINIRDKSSPYAYLNNSYSSIDPSIGLLIALSSPRINERIAFQSGIYYIQSSYSALVELGGSYKEFNDTFIDLSTLSVPLSLKYSFPENKYGAYFQGGLDYDYHLKTRTRLLSERVYGNVVNTFPEVEAFKINSSQLGIWGGLGVLKSFEHIRLSISIQYFQMPNLNLTPGFTADNSRILFNLTVFKK